MYVTQPSLTHRIKFPETEFGVDFFNRSSADSLLTAQGEYILKYAEEEMLTKLANTKEYVRNMESTVQGTLRLGVSYAFAQYELAPILSSYKKLFPDVEIYLKAEQSSSLLTALQKNEMSIANHMQRCLMVRKHPLQPTKLRQKGSITNIVILMKITMFVIEPLLLDCNIFPASC